MSFIADADTILSDDQAVTATALSTNVIQDLIGAGAQIHNQPAALDNTVDAGTVPFVVQVTEDFATLTSLTVTLESDSVATMDNAPKVHWTSGPIAAAALVKGYALPIDFLPGGTYGRYVAMRYTVAGSDATAGKVHAAVQSRRQTNI